MIGSNRKNLTSQKLKYLKDNLENFQFIAAHALRGNEQFNVLVELLARGGSKPADITEHMGRIVDGLSVTADKQQKKSRSSGESSGDEVKPLMLSVGTYLKSLKKSKEEFLDFDTQVMGDLKKLAATVKRNLSDSNVSLSDFIDSVDSALLPLSKANANEISAWAQRPK